MGLDRWPGVACRHPQGPAGFSIVNEGLERERTEVLPVHLQAVQVTEHTFTYLSSSLAYLCIHHGALGTLEHQGCFWKGGMIYNCFLCVS